MGRFDHRHTILLIAVVTVVVWQVPYGPQVLYPLTILATYAHEMGHGLTALSMGASFDTLKMYADGSGLAHWHGDVGRIGRALIAAGGLVGPSIAGAGLLVLTRKPRLARWVLYALGGLMLLSVLLVVRSLFGFLFVTAIGLGLAGVAHLKRGRLAPLTLQLVGVQLCLAIFRDVGYMFSPGGLVGGVQRSSDSAAIAEALFLPYWFWGGLTAAFSFAVLGLGTYLAWTRGKAERGESWESIVSPMKAGR